MEGLSTNNNRERGHFGFTDCHITAICITIFCRRVKCSIISGCNFGWDVVERGPCIQNRGVAPRVQIFGSREDVFVDGSLVQYIEFDRSVRETHMW